MVDAALPGETALPVESFGVGVKITVGVPPAPVLVPLTPTLTEPEAPIDTEVTYLETMLKHPAVLTLLAHWLVADHDSDMPSLQGDAATIASDTLVRTV